MLPKGITYREKSATRLRELVRTMPWDKLKKLVAKHTMQQYAELTPPTRWDALRRLASQSHSNYPVHLRLGSAALGNPDGALVKLVRRKLPGSFLERLKVKLGPMGGNYSGSTKQQEARIEKLLSSLHERRGGQLSLNNPGIELSRNKFRGSYTSDLAKQLEKHTAIVPKGSKPTTLPYSPDTVVYRGTTNRLNIRNPGVKERRAPFRFITPHPDVAIGYADTGGVILRYPVKGLKFVAAPTKGKPVYTPHTASVESDSIQAAVGNPVRSVGRSDKGNRLDYEGVVSKLDPRKAKMFVKIEGKVYPAKVVADKLKIRGLAENYKPQHEQWSSNV